MSKIYRFGLSDECFVIIILILSDSHQIPSKISWFNFKIRKEYAFDVSQKMLLLQDGFIESGYTENSTDLY